MTIIGCRRPQPGRPEARALLYRVSTSRSQKHRTAFVKRISDHGDTVSGNRKRQSAAHAGRTWRVQKGAPHSRRSHTIRSFLLRERLPCNPKLARNARAMGPRFAVRNRCASYRLVPRAFYRKFGQCRVSLCVDPRVDGQVPAWSRSSWYRSGAIWHDWIHW